MPKAGAPEANDMTIAAEDGVVIEVVMPWKAWQPTETAEWDGVDLAASTQLLGAFELSTGLQRATFSTLKKRGFQELYLSLTPADDSGSPCKDALDQLVLLPDIYLSVKVSAAHPTSTHPKATHPTSTHPTPTHPTPTHTRCAEPGGGQVDRSQV